MKSSLSLSWVEVLRPKAGKRKEKARLRWANGGARKIHISELDVTLNGIIHGW